MIAGTIPVKDFPLTLGEVRREEDSLVIDSRLVACTQGTATMISAALAVTHYLKLRPPNVLVAGDIGDGKGTREIYRYLIKKVCGLSPRVLALHYCLPIVSLMEDLCRVIEGCRKRPFMIADAGAMYAATVAGLAKSFDIFTPDAGELAFLADPDANHPAYSRPDFFNTENSEAPSLVTAAYQHDSAAKLLFVKGATDLVAVGGEILATISRA